MSHNFDQYLEKFHEAASIGNIQDIQIALKGVIDVNKRNEKGWTALMFAARNGHANIITALIEKGCDSSLINSTGHTALDIAKFWNHLEVVDVLCPSENSSSKKIRAHKFPPITNFLCGSHLDRAAHQRKNPEWIGKMLECKKSKIVLLKGLNTVVVPKPDLSLTNKLEQYRLYTAEWQEIKPLLEEEPLVVFLGCDTSKKSEEASEGIAWFAVDASKISKDDIEKLHPHSQTVNALPGIMQLSDKEAAIAGQARSLLAWHDRYQFCATCGSPATSQEAGWKRICTKEDCKSHKGTHNTSYPRIDPTAIMVVISPDGSEILLGRASRFPRHMWSCLAGFMEPGESIEETCRREVFEEAGIKVGNVEYHSTQPWPMPASLMVGCVAYATSYDIKVDKDELDEARWFPRQDAVQMLTHQHPQGLYCPPQQAIAHQLILAWVNMSSNL